MVPGYPLPQPRSTRAGVKQAMRHSVGIGPVFVILAVLSILNCPPGRSIGPGAFGTPGPVVERHFVPPAAPGPGDPIGTIRN